MPAPKKGKRPWEGSFCIFALRRQRRARRVFIGISPYSHPVPGPLITACLPQVEAYIGERRITAWSGVGISICPELDVAAVTEQCGGDKEARAVALATSAYKVGWHHTRARDVSAGTQCDHQCG